MKFTNHYIALGAKWGISLNAYGISAQGFVMLSA